MGDEELITISSSSNIPDEAALDEDRALQLKESGNKALKEGHDAEATRLYTLALSYSPNNTAILCNRALVYIRSESYGLAIADATAAIQIDPNMAKAYYRRGTAEFALNKAKAARKDFRMVCKLLPKDRDARAKLALCEKAVKEAAFAEAIQSEETMPLSATINVGSYTIEKTYDGPHPHGSLTDEVEPLDDVDKERAFFQPGYCPMEFVMVRHQF
jgi:serine/threonine-protein phosphatase 5